MWKFHRINIIYLTIISAMLLATGTEAHGQSMIGLTKDQVEQLVRYEFRDFHKDNMVVKQQFNYLKFVDRSGNRTWIIYFTDKDICHTSKLVCDYSELDRTLEQLNAAYNKTGASSWEYIQNSDTVLVELIRGEWYFTIREGWKQRNF